MTSFFSRRAGFRLRVNRTIYLWLGLLGFAILPLSFPLPSNAQGPLLPAEKEERDFSESPARKFLENLPPTALPRAKDRSTKVPAFQGAAPAAGPAWTALGPFPIPNGQTETRSDPVSGRVTAIAIHPTNPDIAYVGAAQGGLYRTLDGGATWKQLMDNATSGFIGTPLAIGAITIDPTNSGNVLVGTGEGNLSGDSFFGSGFYIVTGADTPNPVVNGPYNLRASDNADIFTGRSIVSIAVDPANHNNVFCATSSGVGGLVAAVYSVRPTRGLYRSTNAFAGVDATGTPGFTQLNINSSETDAIVTSAVIEPGNANNLVCALFSQSGTGTTGGIYRSTNALAQAPSFTRTLPLADAINVKLAINKVGATVTVYATTEEGSPNGRLYKSTNGGASFGAALAAANGFAGGQGFYDIAVAVDPTDANKVYLGGNASSNIFKYSGNGGTSFNSSVIGLHADVHAIAVAPSNPAVIYHGNDGGIWRSIDSGQNWTSLNNNTFSATQFQGLSVHPSDRNFSIGGTQDNGTEFLKPDASFTRADGGDGGYTLIDQNAADVTNVTMYHTYFNQTNNFMGTARVLNAPCAISMSWSFHGGFSFTPSGHCDGTFDTNNGISVADAVNFYAPQTLGPGNPNTWYFGSARLYRSTNRADTATIASQVFTTPISTIAISAQDDNVRVVGLDDGKVFATTTGSTSLRQIAGSGAVNGTSTTPATGVGRIVIDPNNKAIAYLCFSGFGTPANPMAHVWKTTNLNATTVTFTPVSNGLPDIPVNAIAVDPVTLSGGGSTDLYVGTDAGVYYSPDGGSSWSAYGSGFPHVAVFGLEIQNPSRIVRAATHGRGLYETPTVSTILPTPTPTPSPTPPPPVYGEITNPAPGSILPPAPVTFTWTAGNATAYWLLVGNSVGGQDIFSSGQTGSHSFTVKNIPSDGRPIYVRLLSLIQGKWYSPGQDYSYTAFGDKPLTPIISPNGGSFRKKVTVSLGCQTTGTTLYYTIDGTTPTTSSPLYSAAFTLKSSATVKAIATKPSLPNPSNVATASFIVK